MDSKGLPEHIGMEHGHAGTMAFLSPRDYCNQGADIAALGLRNGNEMEFAGKGYG